MIVHGEAKEGIAWRSLRLALDDLEIVSATASRIECRGFGDGLSPVTFGVDPRTGVQIDGPVLSGWLLSRKERTLRRRDERAQQEGQAGPLREARE